MEQLNRLELLIGSENLNKIADKTVLVAGLGGVGSYAVESLVRSGIKKIILVDYDIIDITNLNRQLMTDHTNIGQKKIDVLKKRVEKINPFIEIKCYDLFLNKENIKLVFKEKIDYVIDSLDTIETKKLLIKECVSNDIKIISCMGVGNKMDPTRLKIADIRKTSYDKIAKILRKMIKDEGINVNIPVVYSEEESVKTGEVIGSNSFVPAIAGLLCSSYVINDIIKK
ncbi:MAG: tRNA threonylcarbamoyladenosine dehydratase [Clostridium sp.]|nr:tRNA threonylcarbamoyladenosine dehydratase [Clostridium sp.]MCM1443971.1 tRNA threonylcarbamoyladenosine dehydratase [Candidatus Amulumruptor caecigallinarius]